MRIVARSPVQPGGGSAVATLAAGAGRSWSSARHRLSRGERTERATGAALLAARHSSGLGTLSG